MFYVTRMTNCYENYELSEDTSLKYSLIPRKQLLTTLFIKIIRLFRFNLLSVITNPAISVIIMQKVNIRALLSDFTVHVCCTAIKPSQTSSRRQCGTRMLNQSKAVLFFYINIFVFANWLHVSTRFTQVDYTHIRVGSQIHGKG